MPSASGSKPSPAASPVSRRSGSTSTSTSRCCSASPFQSPSARSAILESRSSSPVELCPRCGREPLVRRQFARSRAERVAPGAVGDTRGDLSNLSVRMSARVARIRDQRIDRAHDDLVGQLHRCASLFLFIVCKLRLAEAYFREGITRPHRRRHGKVCTSGPRLRLAAASALVS